MHWLMIALLGLGAAPTTPRFAGKVPAEGRWFAVQSIYEWDEHPFAILHLTPSGLSTVFSSDTLDPIAFVWADADTLITLSGYVGPMTVSWFDAGVLAAEVVLPPSTVPPFSSVPLGVDADGAAWLLGCVDAACKGQTVARVTRDGLLEERDGLPPDLRLPAQDGLKPTSVEPPDGYAATLTKVEIDGAVHTGLTCTSTAGSTTWPNATTADGVRPWRVKWVDANPPIIALRGKRRNSAGEEVTTTQYFRACTMERLLDYRVLGDGLWLSGYWAGEDDRATWSLWWNDHHIDEVRGDASLVQMAPY